MEEIQIARAKAELFHKYLNPSKYPDNPAGKVTARLNGKEVGRDVIDGATAELALSRARATNRDYSTVLAETEMTVIQEFARILDPTYDLVLQGVRKAVAEEGEEGGGLCGVCQKEMEVGKVVSALGCMHKFHVLCIYEWLKVKHVCPLC